MLGLWPLDLTVPTGDAVATWLLWLCMAGYVCGVLRRLLDTI